jgi:hypothetical protein
VVAFACNDDFGQNPGRPNAGIDTNYITEGYSFITQKCGSYIAGTMIYLDLAPTTDNSPFLGYMRYSDGLDFCGAGEGSPASSC